MRCVVIGVIAVLGVSSVSPAQPLGEPDRGSPGDPMIQEYLRREAEGIHDRFAVDIESLDGWQELREEYRREYLFMLGLWPLPERTPLEVTVTGTLEGDGFVVEKLHYQSRPHLYVTANLYRPAETEPDARLPAILYVCGHSGRGRNGNKTAFQSHGMWFARHGYLCLIVDTLQLGEIAGLHHGTYRENRWWWYSRGYTPAGVECWNGVRGIDYLISRDDVDPQRIAVTGISGGGAATFWVAAADERAAVAVPVSGMADLLSYVPNRVINGHCDCMFLHNAYQWPWTRIAALIAPRPMLFVNSDQDRIFPMDANQRVINRLERVYSLYGASDRVDAVVSIGGHAYREDIRKAVFRFINTHLKGDPQEVTDSEVDLVTGPRNDPAHPIAPEQLRVFPTDGDIPADELNTTIDEHFVPMAAVEAPGEGQFEQWKADLLRQLRDLTLRSLPERVPLAKVVGEESDSFRVETEPGIVIPVRKHQTPDAPGRPRRIRLVISNLDASVPAAVESASEQGETVWVCDVRGVGPTQWTTNNPPNYVERSHVLLGRTVDTGRIRDIAAVARWLRARSENDAPVVVAGEGRMGLLAAYAALIEPDIGEAIVLKAPASHMNADAPPILNVLRVCDVPDVLGMLAPRKLTLRGAGPRVVEKVRAAFTSAGAATMLLTEGEPP